MPLILLSFLFLGCTDFAKETLNARSEYTLSQDDGTAEHRINQYRIKQEIGRGSFGAVHVAADQYGNEYVETQPSLAPRLQILD